MSEPVLHQAPTNPCRRCEGTTRTIMEAEWRDPTCWVICDTCGNRAGARTIPEVLTVWNDENTPVKGPRDAGTV